MAGDGVCHLHGISHHHVQSFDEAAGLYQLGMASCKTAETPDNKRSSRSHTVFSIKMLRQRPGEEIFLRCVKWYDQNSLNMCLLTSLWIFCSTRIYPKFCTDRNFYLKESDLNWSKLFTPFILSVEISLLGIVFYTFFYDCASENLVWNLTLLHCW